MAVDCKEIEKRMQRFEEVCRNSGLKLTHQRREIFREVAQSANHPDVENVYQGVRKRIPSISLDTIYRTLWLFNKLGLILTVGLTRERTRFDANLNHHHHVVCSRCGLTQDFYSEGFDELQLPKSVKNFGLVKTAQWEARGICNQCAAVE